MFSSNNSCFGIGANNFTIQELDNEQSTSGVQPTTTGSGCD